MPVCDDLHSGNSTRRPEVEIYYVRTTDFHLTSYLLAISDYIGLVRGLYYTADAWFISNHRAFTLTNGSQVTILSPV